MWEVFWGLSISFYNASKYLIIINSLQKLLSKIKNCFQKYSCCSATDWWLINWCFLWSYGSGGPRLVNILFCCLTGGEAILSHVCAFPLRRWIHLLGSALWVGLYGCLWPTYRVLFFSRHVTQGHVFQEHCWPGAWSQLLGSQLISCKSSIGSPTAIRSSVALGGRVSGRFSLQLRHSMRLCARSTVLSVWSCFCTSAN